MDLHLIMLHFASLCSILPHFPWFLPHFASFWGVVRVTDERTDERTNERISAEGKERAAWRPQTKHTIERIVLLELHI